MPVAVAAALLGTKEVLDLAAAAGMRPLRWTVYLGNVLLVASAWSVILTPHWHAAGLFTAGIAALLVIFGEMCHYRRPGGNMANLAAGIFALVYVGLMLWFAATLRLVWGVRAGGVGDRGKDGRHRGVHRGPTHRPPQNGAADQPRQDDRRG